MFKPSEYNRTNRVLRGFEAVTGFKRPKKPEPLSEAHRAVFAAAEAALEPCDLLDLRSIGEQLGESKVRQEALFKGLPAIEPFFHALDTELVPVLYPGF